jgi:hypothetical protein
MVGELEGINLAADNASEDADFNAGFTTEALASSTETPSDDASVSGKTNQEIQAPAELATITSAEWKALTAKAAMVDEIKAGQQTRDDKVFGHIGALKQRIEGLSSMGTGQPVTLNDMDFAELKAEYPELSELYQKGLSKVLERIRPSASTIPKEEIETQVTARTAEVRSELIDAHLDAVIDGDWRMEVNTEPFKAWIDAAPSDVKALQESNSVRDAARLLRLFKASKTTAPTRPPAPSARQRVLSAAVNPRGAGVHAPMPSEDDEFNNAFKRG